MMLIAAKSWLMARNKLIGPDQNLTFAGQGWTHGLHRERKLHRLRPIAENLEQVVQLIKMKSRKKPKKSPEVLTK